MEAYYSESANIVGEINELIDLDVNVDIASTCIGVCNLFVWIRVAIDEYVWR